MKELSFTLRREVIWEDLKDNSIFQKEARRLAIQAELLTKWRLEACSGLGPTPPNPPSPAPGPCKLCGG